MENPQTLIKFKNLAIGDTFDFIPMNPPFTAFNRYGMGCVKISARKYTRDGEWQYSIDSINREVIKTTTTGGAYTQE